ncbi:hypothetical protein C8J57DRAFT_1259138 [Mycena rebaudengoi]|nr:hypothetical protein C8J57DRAFT_1259138 [Mycena rebaudengoi]
MLFQSESAATVPSSIVNGLKGRHEDGSHHAQRGQEILRKLKHATSRRKYGNVGSDTLQNWTTAVAQDIAARVHTFRLDLISRLDARPIRIDDALARARWRKKAPRDDGELFEGQQGTRVGHGGYEITLRLGLKRVGAAEPPENELAKAAGEKAPSKMAERSTGPGCGLLAVRRTAGFVTPAWVRMAAGTARRRQRELSLGERISGHIRPFETLPSLSSAIFGREKCDSASVFQNLRFAHSSSIFGPGARLQGQHVAAAIGPAFLSNAGTYTQLHKRTNQPLWTVVVIWFNWEELIKMHGLPHSAYIKHSLFLFTAVTGKQRTYNKHPKIPISPRRPWWSSGSIGAEI